ncbi:MAG: hypothetical protein AB7L17_11825 [Ilumatobacteraceae bacterium]|jgi:hypothetical protein
MEFGHGFLPRIDKRNWTGVDRTLGPPGRLPLGDGLDLPWAVADHAYAHKTPSIMRALHDHDVKVICDSSAWRYREAATFRVDAMAAAPYAPKEPVIVIDASFRAFVEANLRAQCELGADAYLVPGFVPRHRNDDVGALTLAAIDIALGMTDLDARPLVGFLGMHSERLEQGLELMGRLNRGVEGLYVQVTPFRPQADTVSKLIRCADVFAEAAKDFQVIAGRAGGAGNFFRALGAHAADAGLAEGETFDFASRARPAKPSEGLQGKGFGRRIYLPAIGLSVSGKEFGLISTTPGLQQFARCALPCCQFKPFDTKRAVEHSLRARVAEACEHHATPRSMAIPRLLDELAKRSSALTSLNAALADLNQKPFKTRHVENQAAALARRLARTPAA